jgi:hypothetical protein
MALVAGRPVIASTVDTDTGSAGNLARLQSTHVYADGFDSGSVAFWTRIVGLP